MSGYRVDLADLGRDREHLLALWQTGLQQGGKPEAKLDWYYRANPAGVPRVLILRPPGGETPVGVASIVPRRMSLGAETFVAGELADFVVAPEHRNFFPALILQRAVRVEALRTHPIVFGMPNENSDAVVQRAGYRRIGSIVRHARVLRSSEYFSRHVPRWLARIAGAAADLVRAPLHILRSRRASGFAPTWIDRPDARFDDLWKRACATGLMIGERDARFLTWRFADSPMSPHRFLVLESGDARTLAAYAACSVVDNRLHVRDFLADRAIPGAGIRLFVEVARAAWLAALTSVSVEFFGDPEVRRHIRDAGWVQREERGFYASFEGRPELLQESRWYITRADEDA
jgi:hypothetical protein